MPGPLTFDGVSYLLAWSAQSSPTYTKQEYVPADQTLERYVSMVMVEVVTINMTVAQAMSAQIRSLNARKAKDPLVNFGAVLNDKTGEAILDFIVSGQTDVGQRIAEWNGYRYVPKPNGGVMLFAISRRAYGDTDIRPFLAKLKADRAGFINRLAQYKFPDARN